MRDRRKGGAEAALGGILFKNIGRPIRRKEDPRLLTGRGQFSDDFHLPGEAHAVMVRSPHPHARIKGIDKSAALAMPGVLGVFTGADVAADGLKPIPHSPAPTTKYDLKLTGPGGSKIFDGPHYLLPAGKARHVGEAVAMVVAGTMTEALDAAEAVHIDYEILPHVTETAKACEPGRPAVWDEVTNNTPVDTTFGDPAATDAAFACAAYVVKKEFHIGRVTAVTMEPRSALAVYDRKTNRYTLWAGSGGAVRQKGELVNILGIERDRLRVISLDVGGNFGARNRVYVEFGLVLWASKKLGRPVKFTATRSEAFLSDYQGRDLVTRVELALDKDGRFLAMRADNISNVGARCCSLSPLGKGSALITGSYDIPVATLRSRAVFTNTMPTQAYRSSGRPEVTYAIERLIELAAIQCGFDALELRRKNLVPPEKMRECALYGAQVIKVTGTYDRAKEIAHQFARHKNLHFDRGPFSHLGEELGQRGPRSRAYFRAVGVEIERKADALGWLRGEGVGEGAIDFFRGDGCLFDVSARIDGRRAQRDF